MRHMRVFLSSTFRDFQVERDQLVDSTFRILSVEAATRGIDFQVIDLRWGIPGTATVPDVIERCLTLVEECQPYFMALIGARYGWVPPDSNGKSVTRMEIDRFFASCAKSEVGYPKGLFLFRGSDRGDASADVQALRDYITESPYALVMDFDSAESLQQHVLSFFLENIEAVGQSSPARPRPLPDLTAALVPQGTFHDTLLLEGVLGAMERGKIVLVDSPDEMLRVGVLSCIASHLDDVGAGRTLSLHVGAEGVLTGKRLASELERYKLIGTKQEAGEEVPNPALTGRPIVAIVDCLDQLADWHRIGEVDLLALSFVFRYIHTASRQGQGWILAADFGQRPDIRALADSLVFPLSFTEGQRRELIRSYFARVGKILTPEQTTRIVDATSSEDLSVAETLLVCDIVRRQGQLKDDAMSQDTHVDALIEQVCMTTNTDLYKRVVTDAQASLPPERSGVVTQVLGLLCVSRAGLAFEDCSALVAGGLEAHEWALLRSACGPMLAGSLGRLQIIDERARSEFRRCLGHDSIERARSGLVDYLISRLQDANSAHQWFDFGRALAMELPYLVRQGESAARILPVLFNPRIWVPVCIYDASLATELLSDCTADICIPQSEFTPAEASSALHSLATVIHATDFSGPGGRAFAEEVNVRLNEAERITGGFEVAAQGLRKFQILLCCFAIRRAMAQVTAKAGLSEEYRDVQIHYYYATDIHNGARDAGSTYREVRELALRDAVGMLIRLLKDRRSARPYELEGWLRRLRLLEGHCDLADTLARLGDAGRTASDDVPASTFGPILDELRVWLHGAEVPTTT